MNLFVIMLLDGLWYGARWTFVARGALHWFFVMINDRCRAASQSVGYRNNHSSRFRSIVSQMLTFLVVVVGCVYFRSEAFDAANNLMSGLAGLSGISFEGEGGEQHLSLAQAAQDRSWSSTGSTLER